MRVMAVLLALGLLTTFNRVSGQFWGGWGYHSSTVEEGIQRGAADVIRSQGMRNLLNSEAAKNIEDARRKYIDNRLKWTKTYFEMKRYNKEYRAAARGPRPTSEQLFRLAKEATPKRLGPSELDPVTGKISWPTILQDEAFAQYRETLDALYAARAKSGGKLTAEQLKAIYQASRDLQIELKRRVREYPPQVYSRASSFIKRLEYESRAAG